jgi:BirA family biotin operon repressor/biotin-[acetyl-CoA-carboxylase] ligase
VGIGVNCVQHPQIPGGLLPTDFAARGIALDPEALFSALAVRMAETIAAWERGSGFAAVRTAWLERAAGLGAPIRVNLPGRAVEGRFAALDETGRLILAQADGSREAFSAGDVFFAAAG